MTDMELKTDWSREGVARRRDTYYAASQRAFVPYREPLIFRRGEGQYLWDETGKRYVDMLGMNLCISVGHTNPVVTRAVEEQARDLQHATTMFYHPVPAHLAEELVATMPAGEDWVVHFTNSGAEAIDLALLMARSYTGNIDFLALRNGYHGATFGAQSLTGIKSFRHPVPMVPGIHHVACPDQYRGVHGPGLDPYLTEIDEVIGSSTSGNLAGMIIEPVQGYGGIVAMPDGYLTAAFERVRSAGGIAVIDEVQSGFARTGDHYWAFERDGVVPDIVVMAKGIGNGYPLAATVAKREVAESMADKFYFNTYGANPVSCAAGRAVLKVIEEDRLQENARVVGAALLEILSTLHQKYDIVGDVRGRGLMMAIELVRDRKTKEPAAEETAEIFEKTRENGLVLSKSGANRNVLRMVPPLCISMDDVGFVGEAMEDAFARAL